MDILTYVVAFLVGSVAAARIVRLVCFDTFPPAAWLRSKWDEKTGSSKWNDLLHCPYCVGPYAVAFLATWAFATDFHWSWWLFCSLASAAYVAAVIPASDWG